ncbi:MAG: hypothetical protein RR009_06010 [Oscillospiraceae bacterium]
MKKYITVLLIALCLTLFVSCGKHTEPDDPLLPAAPETEMPTPPIDGPVYSGTDIANSPFVGKFENSYSALFASGAEYVYVKITVNEDGTQTKEPLQKPTLECRADGTFSLIVPTAIGEGNATINGTFTVDGEIAEFTVAQGSYGDFIGASTEKFTCKLINANDIRFWGDQIGTVSGGDIFTKAA